MAELVEVGPHRLYRGDGLATLQALPDASCDCILTDPPYCAGAISEAQRTRAPGQGLRSENIARFGWFVGDNMGTSGLCWMLRALAWEAVRVVKPTGHLLVFCDWRMLSALQPAIESAGLRYQNLIVWDKKHMGLGVGFRHRHELVMHFTMGSPVYHDKGTSNVLPCPRVPATDREHQTQKPVELLGDMIEVVTPEGGTVCDPMMGSGSTAVAAKERGRIFIGAERDPVHFATAISRMGESLAAMPLFREGA